VSSLSDFGKLQIGPSGQEKLADAIHHHANAVGALAEQLKIYNEAHPQIKISLKKPKVTYSTAHYEEENPIDVQLRKQEAKLRRGAQAK
jgi:hypothetical protein